MSDDQRKVTTLSDLRPGDLVMKPAIPIGSHYGVVIAGGNVLEIRKVDGVISQDGVVCCRTLIDFVGSKDSIKVEMRASDADEMTILNRATELLRMGRIKYGYLGWTGDNCEHIARWIQTGKRFSKQAEAGTLVVLLLAAGAVGYALSGGEESD